MKTPNDNKGLEQQAKTLFDDSVERLDAATLSRLNRGRQAALAEVRDARGARQWVRWMPAAGMAAAAVVAVVMLRGPVPNDSIAVPAATDFEILIGDDSLEMIEELEFYSWLDTVETEATDNVG